jgi:uncharacterized protein
MSAPPALQSGVPTIELDGRPSALLETSLLSLVVEDGVDGLATCEATFQSVGVAPGGGVGFPLFDPDVVDFGADIVITAGAADAHGTLFRGRVVGMLAAFPADGTAELTLLADDGLVDLRTTRRTRVFENVSDAQIAASVAAEHGLAADVAGGGPVHAVVTQLDQSDLAFMRERARGCGAELWLDGRTLHLAGRAERRTRPVPFSHRQNLREAQLRADLAGQRTAVAVSGWDPGTKAAIDVAAGPTAMAGERRVAAAAGFEILERAFGERVERVLHAFPLAVDEAQGLADARFRRQARRFVTGEVLVDGDARVRVGATVDLLGLGARLTGTYDVVAVRHLFDLVIGFRTVASVERAEVGT